LKIPSARNGKLSTHPGHRKLIAMLLYPGVLHRDSFAQNRRSFFYDVQVELGASQLTSQPCILGFQLRSRTFHRNRARLVRRQLSSAAAPDPIP
jgi:hypothetical protein